MTEMVKVRYQDLWDAFDFLSFGQSFENRAYISLDTGKIFYFSDEMADDERPDDVETSDRYLPVPDKNDLQLGSATAHRFARLELPDRVREVEDMFSHRGAYSKFKGLLERWYEYEKEQVEAGLREWGEENGIEVVGGVDKKI